MYSRSEQASAEAYAQAMAARRERMARAVRACALAWLCLSAGACSGDDAVAATQDAGEPDGAQGDGGEPGGTRYRTTLASAEQYAALAGEGAEVKYLLALEGRGAASPLDAACVFQNTRAFPFHVDFLNAFPAYEDLDYDSYLALVLRRATRVWWGGGLKLWANAVHPTTGRAGVISFSVYQEGGGDENLAASELAEVHARLVDCAPYARELLAFVPDGPAQLAHVRAIAAELQDAGVPVLEPDALRPGIAAEVYSEGEAYGYLRIVPQGEALTVYGPEDVVVAQSAPNDVSLLAALITQNPQSLHSHANLRLREKAIPNASVPAIYENAVVLALAGELVHVSAGATALEIEPAELAQAQAFWERERPAREPLAADLEVAALAAFSAIGHADAAAYGTKAANLGELRALLPPEHRTEGFAVPFQTYVQFMQDSGLDAMVEALLDDPELLRDAEHRRARLSELRDAIRGASVDAALLDRVDAQARGVFGDAATQLRLRFRSSTNAEDLASLSGAGLYESKSGCLADDFDADTAGPSLCLTADDAAYYREQLDAARAELDAHPERVWLEKRIEDFEGELADEKSAALAMRKVWASLWTERAFEERQYWRIDHRAVFMALAVNRSFTREQLDAVAVTALPNADGAPLYRVVTQVAEIGVVQPEDPTAVAETLVFERGEGDEVSDPRVLVPSSFAEASASLWSDAQLRTLGGLLFQLQDHFAREVYPETPELSLDVELKLTADDQIAIKQARPYASATR